MIVVYEVVVEVEVVVVKEKVTTTKSDVYGWREVHGQNFAQHANVM